jgi:hypothetical protein
LLAILRLDVVSLLSTYHTAMVTRQREETVFVGNIFLSQVIKTKLHSIKAIPYGERIMSTSLTIMGKGKVMCEVSLSDNATEDCIMYEEIICDSILDVLVLCDAGCWRW